MKRIALLAALALPLAALAAPPPGRGPGAPDEAARREHMEKRLRMARTLGLAEALDLPEAEALRMRDTLAGFDARSAPLRAQVRESMEVVRRAARGDAAAQKGLDEALRRLREAGSQLRAVHDEMFQALTKDLSPERKARAALFLHRFQRRMGDMQLQHRGGRGSGQGMGPGMGGGPGPRWGMAGPGGDGPEAEMPAADELL